MPDVNLNSHQHCVQILYAPRVGQSHQDILDTFEREFVSAHVPFYERNYIGMIRICHVVYTLLS